MALTTTQIAQLSAILTGGGYKKAATRDAAEKRFTKLAGDLGIDAAAVLAMDFDAASSYLTERKALADGAAPVAAAQATPKAPKAPAAPVAEEEAPAPVLPRRSKGGEGLRALMAEKTAKAAEEAKARAAAAPAPKAKKAKAPKPEGEAAARSRIALGAVITEVVPNPKKPGGKSHQIFSLYRPGQTVEEFIKAVEGAGFPASQARVDLSWDRRHGFIKIAG